MNTTGHYSTSLRRTLPQGLFFVAATVLAIGPVAWLVRTWTDPAYNSAGALLFLAWAGLVAWSVVSPIVRRRSHWRWLPALLLGLSAAVRLAGQLLAINTLGAVCLVIDVIALAMLLRLDTRARPLSPLWIGIVFAFSLPLERIAQRAVGYLLQHLSADGACHLLGRMFDGVTCQGTRIVIGRTDVLVDLPCSGARGLILCALAFAVACALIRPRAGAVLVGAVLTLGSAIVANIIRIAILAIGLARPEYFGKIDVMAAPWHDLIGLTALALAMLPVLVWSRWAARPASAVCPVFKIPPAPLPTGVTSDGWWLSPPAATNHPALVAAAFAALLAAAAIVSMPARPVDVARTSTRIALPLTLDGHVRRQVALTDRERVYFTRFGGTAAKAQYGAAAMMLVRTTSPLRHLHSPEDCLRGIGFDVRYRGIRFAPLPTAVYSATAPDGSRYRIDVSFVSGRGEITTNVATAVWRWLEGRAQVWTAVQRITPEAMPEHQRARFTDAVIAALELPGSTTVSNHPAKGD